MNFAKKIIEELRAISGDAYLSKDSARKELLNTGKTKYIHISTSASLSQIREVCKKLSIDCKIHSKINAMTLELIIKNKYIIYPFVKTTLKNNYAVRKYSKSYEDDQNSQGFTINTFMIDTRGIGTVISLPKAKADLDAKLIRLNGDPHSKITENRMFLLEAGILQAELGNEWQIEHSTYEAIQERALEISIVSAEAIKKALTYLIEETDKPSLAFRFYKNTGILDEIMPELLRGVGLAQSNKSNTLDLFNHIMYALDSVDRSKTNYVALRWACIFHDIAKPYTKSYDAKGNIHFYGHDKIGAIFATRWMEKYKFDKALINKVNIICRHHLFDASPRLDIVGIKRLIKRIGKDNIFDLLDMREADRWGTGRPDISMKKIDILRDKIKKILNTP